MVIFDCDGVLVDSETISSRVFAEVATEAGAPLSAEQVFKVLRGGSMAKSIAFVEEILGGPAPIDIQKEYRERAFKAYATEMKAIEGIEKLIQSLNVPHCIASNGPRAKIDFNIRVTGLDKYFPIKHIFSAYDIDDFKPDPGLLFHTAERMNTPVDQCIFIDDSKNGAQAAQRAGMRCFGFGTDTNPQLFDQYGAIHVKNTEELRLHIDHILT